MKSITEYLSFEVPDRRGFVNITGTVEAIVRKSGVQEGLCLVNAMHITAMTYELRQKLIGTMLPRFRELASLSLGR